MRRGFIDDTVERENHFSRRPEKGHVWHNFPNEVHFRLALSSYMSLLCTRTAPWKP